MDLKNITTAISEGENPAQLAHTIENWLETYNISSSISLYTAYVVMAAFMILICVLTDYISKRFLLRLILKIVEKTKTEWDEKFYQRKVFHKIAHIVPAVIIYMFAPAFDKAQGMIQKGAIIYMILLMGLTINAALNAVMDIYRTFSFAKNRPIKGYIQVVKIFIWIFAGIGMFTTLTNNSSAGLALLSSIGGLSAVLMLVFKDSILGLVAGVQLSANEMVKIGDWIEVPQFRADGSVEDITLHTIKVHNWDHTITTIPTYALISDSFKNWSYMEQSGGRRIKRAIYIDMTSIRFLLDEEVEKLKSIQLLEKYLTEKQRELKVDSQSEEIPFQEVNKRKLTNIGTFRAYVQAYLNEHPLIHDGFIKMVRQLQPSEKGLPLEIYAFCKETSWANYEAVQADIFDHLLAIINLFDLKIYQNLGSGSLKDLLYRGDSNLYGR